MKIIDIDRKGISRKIKEEDIKSFKEKWEEQYKGVKYGNRVKIWVGDKEVIGNGSWKMTTIPWYLRLWYRFK